MPVRSINVRFDFNSASFQSAKAFMLGILYFSRL
jgi:hypothetical protein